MSKKMKGYNIPKDDVEPEFTPPPPDLYEQADKALKEAVEEVYNEAKRNGKKLPVWRNGRVVYLDYKNFVISNIANYLADHYQDIYLNKRDVKEQKKIAKRIMHYAYKGYR